MSRYNQLRHEMYPDTSLDELVMLSDGRVDFDPYLTTHISDAQFTKLYRAVEFANRIGLVLNAWLTISWQYAGEVRHDCIGRLTGLFTERLRKHCHENGLPCAYIYVHENSDKHGLHTHFLLHMPKAREEPFDKWTRGCLGRLARPILVPKNALKLEVRKDTAVENQWFWFRYAMKGIVPGWRTLDDGREVPADSLIKHHLENPGHVRCRYRVNVSRNLDSASIAATRPGGRHFYSSWDRQELSAMYERLEWLRSIYPDLRDLS